MAKRKVKKKAASKKKAKVAKKKIVARAAANKTRKKKKAPAKKPVAKTRVVTTAPSTVDLTADEATTQLPLFDASQTQAVPAAEVVGEIEEQLALGKLTES